MKFSVNRDVLLRPLQQVAGVVEHRPSGFPILANLLLQVDAKELSIIGTDFEVELITRMAVTGEVPGEITVPARKLMDICRGIPEEASIAFSLNEQRLEIKSGKFRSVLSTLPADDFPMIKQDASEISTTVDSKDFSKLLGETAFAMGQQDKRHFLNGMSLELGDGLVRSVTTDGHRLALSELPQPALKDKPRQVIVPRKGIIEIQRLLQEVEGEVSIVLGSNHLGMNASTYSLTTKLIDAKYPDYKRVIPKDGDKVVVAEKRALRDALNRTAILANEKFRGIRLALEKGSLQLSANNPDQEEAEETIDVDYQGDPMEVGFNATYLQDVLGVLEGDKVRLVLRDSGSSAVITDAEAGGATYVVMPMRL